MEWLLVVVIGFLAFREHRFRKKFKRDWKPYTDALEAWITWRKLHPFFPNSDPKSQQLLKRAISALEDRVAAGQRPTKKMQEHYEFLKTFVEDRQGYVS